MLLFRCFYTYIRKSTFFNKKTAHVAMRMHTRTGTHTTRLQEASAFPEGEATGTRSGTPGGTLREPEISISGACGMELRQSDFNTAPPVDFAEGERPDRELSVCFITCTST